MNVDAETWTTRRLLQWTTQHFEKHGLESPRVQAEMLLAHVTKTDRLKLYMQPDRPADPAERDALRELVKRATQQEPVDYLVGHAPFFSLDFEVSPAVLIPRPSTETLVEHVLQTLRGEDRNKDELQLADVGTGSGAIVVSLLKQLPNATAVATDIDAAALDVAQRNAEKHGVAERVAFKQGDLLAPLEGETFDVLVSNPPYIPDAQWDDVEPNVKDHEPTHALRGGADGLDLLRPLIAGAAGVLNPGGLVAFEIAAVQADTVRGLAADAGWRDVDVLKDHEALDRVVVGRV